VATGGADAGQRSDAATDSVTESACAKHLGAARAAAKLAGGVFYSREENLEMVAKLKALQRP